MTTSENTGATSFCGTDSGVEPFRWNPESTITCDTGAPPGRVGQLTEFLASPGIPFNPDLQISALNRHPRHAVKFTGEDIPELVDAINRHLSGRKRPALLTMAAHHFSWAHRRTGPSFRDEICPQGWQNIAEEYAIVFNNSPR